MKLQRLAAVFIGVAVLALRAQAQLYLLSASGQVETLEGMPSDPSIKLGSELSIHLWYDLSVPGVPTNIFPGSKETLYTPLANDITIGSFTFALLDYTQLTPARLLANNGYYTFGYDVTTALGGDLFLLSSHLELFDQVPDISQPLSVFDYQAEIFASGADWNATGTVTSFSITEVESPTPVPEPSTYGVFGCVMMGALVWRRRRAVNPR